MNDLTAMPTTFAAGTTLTYRRSYADFPANDGWTLKLALNGASKITVDAAPDGTDHVFTLTAVQTAALAAGVYKWAERAVKTGIGTFPADSGDVTITPDLFAAAAGTLLSFEEKQLAIIEAAINKTLAKGMQTYQIDGIAVGYCDLETLETLRTKWQAKVDQKKARGRTRVHRATFPRY